MKIVRAILPWITLGLALSPAAAPAQEWTALKPPPTPPGVRADSIVPGTRDRAAAATFGELVRGRAAGLNVLQSSGSVGTAPRLWIRGPQSILLRNDPLVVVDGVRIVSEPDAFGLDIGGQTASRLEDLSPDDIASMRVLRGPAATALYGPEGAAGVLEITTRGGAGHREGAPRVHAWSSVGVRQQATEFPANYGRRGVAFGGQAIDFCTLQLEAGGICTPTQATVDRFNPLEEHSPFRDGIATSAGVRLGGRAGPAGYALSGGTESAEGVLHGNEQDLRHLRGSVSVDRGGARLALAAGHVRRETGLPFSGLRIGDRIGSGLTGFPRDDANGGYAPELIEEDEYSLGQEVRHTTFGGSLEWDVLPWLTLGGRGGRDQLEADARMSFTESDFTSTTSDERTRWHWSGQATARAGRADGVHGALTVGLERLRNELELSTRDESSGGFSETETLMRLRQQALFARGDVAWRALRLGGTVRRDQPQFGEDEPDRVSWSVGGEWNVTGAFAAPAWLDGLTLRAAHGQTERGVEWLAGTGDAILGCGPGCGPEMVESLTETEAGVDLRLFDRVELGVTGYVRETEDVIGAAMSGLTPYGSVSNRGVEAAASVHGPERGAVRWRIDANVASNRNEFESEQGGLGAGLFTAHRDGYPLGSYFTRPITGFADPDGDGIIAACDDIGICEVTLGADQEYAGSPLPELLGSLAGTLRLRERVTLHVRADWQGGAEVLDFTTAERCVLVRNCATGYDPDAPLEDQAAIIAWGLGSRAGYIHEADFVRLREVAVTVSAPDAWTRRLGAAGLELTFAGRNLALWTDYPGLDPETSVGGPNLYQVLDVFEQPPVRTFTTRIDVRF